MKRYQVALLIAVLMIGSALLVGMEGRATSSEYGEFPNRTFVLSKGYLGKPDRTALVASILPSNDCVWWVEVTDLGGPSVLLEVTDKDGASLYRARLSLIGEESDHLSLEGGVEYSVVLTYVGKIGVSILKERTLNGPTPPTLHAPIMIGSNTEFTQENGVVDGSGTAADPFLIQDWEIYSLDVHCIEIRDTDAYVVIRNCFLHGILGIWDSYINWTCNIKLADCSNVALDRVQAVKNDVGLRIERGSHIQILDSVFSDNVAGVYVYPGQDVTIDRCKVDFSGEHGVYFGKSNGFEMTNCEVSHNRQLGLGIYQSVNGVISDNTLASNGQEGVSIWADSRYVELRRNTLLSNGIWINGETASGFSTLQMDTTNTIDGKPVLFFTGMNGLVVENVQAGEVIIGNCSDVVVRSLELFDVDVGINIGFVTGLVVEGCEFGQNGRAIDIESSADISILNCTASGNQAGVVVRTSSNVAIRYCNFSESEWDAVMLHYCIGGEIVSNSLRESGIGLQVQWCSGFTVRDNIIENNPGIGINLGRSNDCKLYHNDLLGMSMLAQDYLGSNQWDNGYPDGGNYWSDYKGHDLDKDGIGDTPYSISGGGVDNYPLMNAVWK